MANDIKRDNKGRFLKGAPSPNDKGRPFKLPEDPTLPASRRRAIFRVADRMIDVKVVGGKTERMSVYEANLLNLAREGATGNRTAAKTFIDLVINASEVNLVRRLSTRRFTEQMETLEAQNAEMQRQLKPQQNGVLVLDNPPPVTAAPDEVYDDGRTSLDDPPSGKSQTPEE